MNIIYFDELELINKDIKILFEKAANLVMHEHEIDAVNIEISVSIVDKNDIKDLNREYRGIDKATDVLSFPQYGSINEIKEIGSEIVPLGDVVICIDKAKEQAEEFRHSLERELIYLFVHSVLHLLGYDHLEEEDKREMRNREDKIMHRINILR